MTPEEAKSWLEEREQIHQRSTPGKWMLSLPESDFEETIIDSSDCQGIWIATTDNEGYEEADGRAIIDAHKTNPIMVKALQSILEQCDLLEDHLKYSEHESTREHARGALWAAETIREQILEDLRK